MKTNHILRMENISKSFPGARALRNVSFNLRAGEVHVLLGENGAGKSTLIKILAGAYLPDTGEIIIDGKEQEISNPRKASALGVSVIHQELNIVTCLAVAENIFLGRQPLNKCRFVDWNRIFEESTKVLARINSNIDPKAMARRFSVPELQMVEIAKALLVKSRIIVMDEPTASLTTSDIGILFETIRQLKSEGVGMIYISHRLEEVKEIGDRVTVLRDGEYIGTREIAETNVDELIKMMVGRELVSKFPYRKRELGKPVLEVKGLRGKEDGKQGALNDISLSLRQSEILGIAGLVGSGRTELARAIMGADPIEDGVLIVNGKKMVPKSPLDSIKKGIGLLPEDRKSQGVTAVLPVDKNITLVALERTLKWFLISPSKEKSLATEYVQQLSIVTPSLKRKVMYLSGGNQQKVVLAKWLCSQAEILIFDEPTRGIDVGAKQEIYRLMLKLTEEGASIIMISSELPEILGMSDRVLVMRRGRINGELVREDATQEEILRLAM